MRIYASSPQLQASESDQKAMSELIATLQAMSSQHALNSTDTSAQANQSGLDIDHEESDDTPSP